MRNYQMQWKRHGGFVLIWVALLLFVLIGFVGLAIDWGYVVWSGQKLQNAADAAAMAGAQRLGEDEEAVRDAAVYLASQNEAGGIAVDLERNDENDDEEGELLIGQYDRDTRTFTPTLDNPNAVRVHARRTAGSHGGVPLFFGPLFGKATADISRFAVAIAEQGPADSSVIALDPDDRQSFYVQGNPIIDLGNGAVQVNSNHSTEAGLIGGNGTLIASQVNLVGRLNFHGNSYQYDGENNPDSDFVPDPLADLPIPSPLLTPLGTRNGVPTTSISDTGQFTPGYYAQGLDLNNSQHATLLPGIYVLGGNPAFRVRGQARITSHVDGVMFYIMTGELHVNGGGEIRLNPPVDGIYQGISFFQARTNTRTANFNGNSLMGGVDGDGSTGIGVLYFPAALLQVGGTGDTYVGKLIANNIELYGGGRKTVIDGYDTNEGTDVVYLVE